MAFTRCNPFTDSDSGNSSGSDSDGEDVQSRGSELKLCAGKVWGDILCH